MKEEPLKIRVPAAPVGSSHNHPISGEAAVFLLIVAQLAALLFVIRLFKLEEGHGLIIILIPLFVGFIIHGLLPVHFRIPFFLLLSLTIYGLVIGPANTLIVLGIGAVLILLAHLPIHYRLRVLLILIAAVILGLFRAEIRQRNQVIFFSGVANQAFPINREIGGRWFDEILNEPKHFDVAEISGWLS